MVLSLIFILLCGIAFPVGGCAMQRSWSNQLGDVYSVGIGSAACLGGAFAACFGFPLYFGAMGACLLCTLLSSPFSKLLKVENFVTFGMIFGATIGSCGTIVANNATPEALQEYYRWSSSSYFTQEWWMLLAPAVVVPVCMAFLVGRPCGRTTTYVLTSLMVGSLLPAVGFVGMISLVAPNLARILRPGAKFPVECAIAAAIGVSLLLTTNLLIYFNPFGIYLPASATMAIIATPLLLLTLKK